jgi:hypothetical protein
MSGFFFRLGDSRHWPPVAGPDVMARRVHLASTPSGGSSPPLSRRWPDERHALRGVQARGREACAPTFCSRGDGGADGHGASTGTAATMRGLGMRRRHQGRKDSREARRPVRRVGGASGAWACGATEASALGHQTLAPREGWRARAA